MRAGTSNKPLCLCRESGVVKNMPEPSEIDTALFEVRLSPESNSAATLQHRESRLHTCFLDQTCSMSKLFIEIDVLSHSRKLD